MRDVYIRNIRKRRIVYRRIIILSADEHKGDFFPHRAIRLLGVELFRILFLVPVELLRVAVIPKAQDPILGFLLVPEFVITL